MLETVAQVFSALCFVAIVGAAVIAVLAGGATK